MPRKTNDFSILILRLAAGSFMLVAHGWIKLISYATMSTQFPDPFGLGHAASLGLVVFAEVVCAALVAVGFFTRLASIPLITTMAVAVFKIHAADPWAKKELALLYLACFIVIFLAGGGKYTLQNFFKISSDSRFPFFSWLTR